MIRISDIHSVTEFQRNPKGLLGKIRETQNPTVLTVNGKAEFVVQAAESYELLLDRLKQAEDTEAIRTGLMQSLSGNVRPAEDYFAEFELKHGI